MQRLGHKGTHHIGSPGINLAIARVNHFAYKLNDYDHMVDQDYTANSDLHEYQTQKSRDDDYFKASYWHRYYRITNRKDREVGHG